GEERIGYDMPERPDLPRREDSKRSLQPAEVPVGLSRRAHGGGSERAVEPYRVDLEQSSHRAEHGGDAEEQPGGSRRVGGPQLGAHNVRLRAPRPRELGVLLPPQDGEMGGNQSGEERRDDED